MDGRFSFYLIVDFFIGPDSVPGSAVGWSLRCKDSVRFTYFKLPLRGIFENYSINELLTQLFRASPTIFWLFTENYQRAVFQPSTRIRRHFSQIVTNKMLRNGSPQPMAIRMDKRQKKCSPGGTSSMWQYGNAVMLDQVKRLHQGSHQGHHRQGGHGR